MSVVACFNCGEFVSSQSYDDTIRGRRLYVCDGLACQHALRDEVRGELDDITLDLDREYEHGK